MNKKIIIIIFTIILLISCNNFVLAEDKLELELNLSDIERQLEYDDFALDYSIILEYVKSADYKNLINYIKTNILNFNLVYHNKIMLRILYICLLSVVINMFSQDNNFNLTDKILLFSALGVLIELYIHMYAKCLDTVNLLLNFIKVSLPLYFSITSVLFYELPISVYSVFVIFIGVFQWLSVNLLFPLQTFSLMCTLFGGICSDFDFKHIKKQIVGFVRIILGVYTTFFILGLKITQTISYSSQKLIMTGIQYTLSKGIPVIGGFLSETAETLFSSIVLIHNSIGVTSVIVIIIMAFLPFFTVFGVSLFIKLFCSILITFGNSKITETVYGVGECLCEMSVILLCCSVTFVIAIATELISVR